jgi:signal transduction histidine kinase
MEVLGVKSLLLIAFTNLLKNASLYSTNNKASVIIKHTDQKNLVVSINNEGKTLSDEEQKKIFEPFTRGENSIQIQGSGLGLPIVKRILDYHNATILYQSLGENNNQFQVAFSI